MSIVSHISVGTSASDFPKTLDFYDAIMAELGAKRQMMINKEGEKIDVKSEYSDDVSAVAYGKYYPEFWVQLPENKKEATTANGVHIAFSCSNKAHVDKVYQKAIEKGGTCNGPPGPRPEYSDKYYGAFFIDPFGNKLEAVFFDMGIFNYCNIL